MSTPEWIFAIGIIAVTSASIGYFLWSLGSLLDDYFSLKRRKQFESDLALAIKTTQPTLDQVIQIARTRLVTTREIYWVLQRLLREVLTGRNKDLEGHRRLIEQFVAKMDEAEPFEGMPSQIRTHLERLREHAPGANAFLDALTSQIRELLSINEKERKQQKYYTVGGFFVGVVGILFAVITYFYPNTPPSSEASARPPTVSGPK